MDDDSLKLMIFWGYQVLLKKKKEKFLQCMRFYLSNTLSYLRQVVYVAALQSRTGTGLRLGDTDMVLWQDEPLKSSVIKKNVSFSDTTEYRTLPTKNQRKSTLPGTFLITLRTPVKAPMIPPCH